MLAEANLSLAKAEFTQAEEDYLAYKQSAQKKRRIKTAPKSK
jgi:hypothetical protein